MAGTGGLDDQKLSLLARWASGLCRDQRPEVAAAGRAIELLIDEIERLHVLLWEGPLGVAPPTAHEPPVTAPPRGDLPVTLAERLKKRLGPTRAESSESA